MKAVHHGSQLLISAAGAVPSWRVSSTDHDQSIMTSASDSGWPEPLCQLIIVHSPEFLLGRLATVAVSSEFSEFSVFVVIAGSMPVG